MMLPNIVNFRTTFRKVRGLKSFHQENDLYRFHVGSRDLLIQTEKAVKDSFQRHFHTFRVTRTLETLTIELSPQQGTYLVEADEETKSLYYLSPVSGRHTYVLNSETNEWISPQDGHSFLFKLVRDLSHQCNNQ